MFTVRQLRQRVKKGQADESTLSRAEAILQVEHTHTHTHIQQRQTFMLQLFRPLQNMQA